LQLNSLLMTFLKYFVSLSWFPFIVAFVGFGTFVDFCTCHPYLAQINLVNGHALPNCS
jgi:hypothetical protein